MHKGRCLKLTSFPSEDKGSEVRDLFGEFFRRRDRTLSQELSPSSSMSQGHAIHQFLIEMSLICQQTLAEFIFKRDLDYHLHQQPNTCHTTTDGGRYRPCLKAAKAEKDESFFEGDRRHLILNFTWTGQILVPAWMVSNLYSYSEWSTQSEPNFGNTQQGLGEPHSGKTQQGLAHLLSVHRLCKVDSSESPSCIWLVPGWTQNQWATPDLLCGHLYEESSLDFESSLWHIQPVHSGEVCSWKVKNPYSCFDFID